MISIGESTTRRPSWESILLSPAQRHELEQLISCGTAPVRSIMHAHILLKADASSHGPRWSDHQIEEAFGTSYRTILRTRKRFVQEGLHVALHRKKQGQRPEKRRLDGEQEAYIIAVLCHEKPKGHERWTLRLLAKRAVELEIVECVSHETIRDLLKKRVKAVAEVDVVHRNQRECAFCSSNGRGVGGVSTQVRRALSASVCR